MIKRLRRRGFTLIEILMVVLLLGLFSVIALQQLRQGRDKAGAQGFATLVSEELRRVRQEAIARRRPTAFIVPTDGGRSSIARSFYVMEGESRPRVTRSRNYLSEFDGADLFMGRWPLAGGGSWDTTSLSVPGSKWSGFQVDTWLAGLPALQDYCFVFLPDGTVQTNDLLSYDNRYHLLVAAGADCSASSSNATLSSSGEAYTISISPVGGISLSRGVLAAGPSLATRGRRPSRVAHRAPTISRPPPEVPTPINSMPKIVPTPNPGTISGSDPPDALITRDQYVSLEMQAVSSSGEQLFCQWKVDGPSGKTGAFSLQSQSTASGAGGRMEWDQSLNGGAGAWKALWQWRPPVDALPAERYQLTCEVQNLETGEVKVEIKKFDIRPPGKIFFESDRTGVPCIFTMDESGQRERLYLGNRRHPTATLNGQRLIYVSNADNNLYLHHPTDPDNDLQLTNTGDCDFPAISPNGNLVAYYRGDNIWVQKVAGLSATPRQVPTTASRPGPLATLRLAWKRDGRTLIYPQGNLLMFIDIDGSAGAPVVGAVQPPHSTGTGAISSATDTVDNGVIYTDNYSPYDPWIKRDDTNNRQYLSVGFEDSSVERNPRGEGQFMICRAALPLPADRQLRIVTITGPGTAVVGPPLTSQGSNTRPVWTQ